MKASDHPIKILLVFILWVVSLPTHARFTIEDLQQSAQQNYPLIIQYDLIDRSKEFTLSNINRQNLPQIIFGMQATYQSQVMGFPDRMKELYSQMGVNLKGLNKDQYKAVLEINQQVWDGGDIAAQRKIASAESDVRKKETEQSVYEIRERVNDLFFSILLIQASEKQNLIYRGLLEANLNKINSLIKNGVAMEADALMIEVEILKSEQQLLSLRSNGKAFLQMLSLLTGKEILSADELLEPAVSDDDLHMEIKRPEIAWFDSQINLQNKRIAEVNATSMPKIGVFVQGFYGNPGLNLFDNMIRDKWGWDYIAGIKIGWSLSSFYYKKNKTRIFDYNKLMLENQKETFLFNTNIQIIQQQAMIRKAKEMLSRDDRIIALRESIRITGESKLKNGIIDVTDLLNDISNENSAKIDRILHKTELLKSIYDLKFTTNN